MIIDADSHVLEPDGIYAQYADARLLHLIPERPEYGLLEGATPLGGVRPVERVVRPTQSREAHPEAGFSPLTRLADMDREGIDQMVCFPSVATSLCRYSVEVEAAMVRSYNKWMVDFCSAAPRRLFAPIVLPLQRMEAALEELQRSAPERCFVGITIPSRLANKNLDADFFYPLWSAAESLDLPILVHSGTARPPYPIGTFEQSDNFFLMHLMHHPTEQMLALSALIGGGVLDRFRHLRFGFFEGGCGWVPWYFERLSHHAGKLHEFVPLLQSDPFDYIRNGRVFFSCDAGELSISHFLQQLGCNALMYASDYPHWDSGFPHSVSSTVQRIGADENKKAMILGRNAQQLYTRLF